MKNFKEYIVIDPNIRFGKPILKNTRISVADVIGWLSNGMEKDEIISDFPELTIDMINACLAFVAQRENHILVA
jgi:uncharacterized protein (DUF433 family)